MCERSHTGQRSPSISLHKNYPPCLETGSLTVRELTKEARLDGQRAPAIWLSPPSQHWDCGCVPLCPALACGSEDRIQVPCLCSKHLPVQLISPAQHGLSIFEKIKPLCVKDGLQKSSRIEFSEFLSFLRFVLLKDQVLLYSLGWPGLEMLCNLGWPQTWEPPQFQPS